MGRITIHDVSKAAGVSIKTVSRVLNSEPNVRSETRARVLKLVEELNYHPSLSARSLAGRSSNLIGLIYQNPSANYVVLLAILVDSAVSRGAIFAAFRRPEGPQEGD